MRFPWISVDPLLIVTLVVLAGMGRLAGGLLFLGLVLLHEVAHALVAHHYGLRVSRVELTPFGGRAYIPELTVLDPSVEISIALAGPFCNLLLAAVAPALAGMAGRLLAPGLLSMWTTVNLSLALFNLLPGLPLDGGRVVRALLASRLGWTQATRRLAAAGQGLGLLVAASGGILLWNNAGLPGFSFLLTGVFFWLAARSEYRAGSLSFQRYVLQRTSGIGNWLTGTREGRWLVVHEEEPLQMVVQRLLPHRYHWVVAVDGRGRPRALLNEAELFALARRHGLALPMKAIVEAYRRASPAR